VSKQRDLGFFWEVKQIIGLEEEEEEEEEEDLKLGLE